MSVLNVRKEVSVLPALLEPDTIYAIRTGVGFDLYTTDNTGTVAYKLNNTDDAPKSPVLSYTNGALTSITYSNGTVKTLSYINGQLSTINTLTTKTHTKKTINYSSGVLSSIAEINL